VAEKSDGKPACDPTLSRAQFLKLLVQRATMAGAIVALPLIADSFSAPAQAQKLISGQTQIP